MALRHSVTVSIDYSGSVFLHSGLHTVQGAPNILSRCRAKLIFKLETNISVTSGHEGSSTSALISEVPNVVKSECVLKKCCSPKD